MQLHQIAQHAADLDRAAAFYTRHFGAEPMARFDPPGLVFLRLDGGARLLLDRAAPSALIYLRVPDAQAEIARLRSAGVVIDTEAHLVHTDEAGDFGTPGEQEWMGFVRDSEANLIGLASRHAAPVHSAGGEAHEVE